MLGFKVDNIVKVETFIVLQTAQTSLLLNVVTISQSNRLKNNWPDATFFEEGVYLSNRFTMARILY